MQKLNKLLSLTVLAISLASSFAAVAQQNASTKDSIVTVDQLLALDNLLAKETAAKDPIYVNPSQAKKPGGTTKMQVQPAIINVSNISGVNGSLHINASYNGRLYDDIGVGSSFGNCVVESVNGQCVSFRPTVVAKKKKKAASPNQCPRSCWTGIAEPIYQMPPMGLNMPLGSPTGGFQQPQPQQPQPIPRLMAPMPTM